MDIALAEVIVVKVVDTIEIIVNTIVHFTNICIFDPFQCSIFNKKEECD